MKRVNKTGKCVGCGNLTDIQLDSGKYACLYCLNATGYQTRNIREYIEGMVYEQSTTSTLEIINNLLAFFKILEENEVTSIENAIKTLDAIKIYREYCDGVLEQDTKNKIEGQLDIFNFL